MDRLMGSLRLPGLPRPGARRTVGMDVDRGAIKAVEVSRERGDFVLRHVGYHRLPPGTIVGGEVADADLLAGEIKEFWSAHSFGSRSVVLGVANQKVVVRIMDFPRMAPADLEGAVGFEAQDHIPMPLDDAVVDHVVLGPRGPARGSGSGEDRVLVVAAQRGMVARYTAALRAGGLRPAGVDVKALALTRSTLPGTFFAEEGAVLLLDVGTELSSLAIVQGGNPLMARSVRIGLGDFLEAVADAANLPEDEAEKLALDPSMRLGSGGEVDRGDLGDRGDYDPALAYDVRRGLEGAAEALAEEVSRSVEHHGSEPGAREVSRVIVSGEGALVPGLWAYLGELLGVATGPGRPTEKLAANRSNVSDEQLGAMEPVLAVCVGLAMEEG